MFRHLNHNPQLAKPNVRPEMFGSQVIRPTVGILLYILAATAGWFVHPAIAVVIFIFIGAYYAWTSQGIHPSEEVNPTAAEEIPDPTN